MNKYQITTADAVEVMRANNITMDAASVRSAIEAEKLPFGFYIPPAEGRNKTGIYKLSRLRFAEWLLKFWGAEIMPEGVEIKNGAAAFKEN